MSNKQQTPSKTSKTTSTKEESTNQASKNGGAVGRSLLLLIAAIVVGTLWFVFQSKNDTDKTLDSAESVQESQNADDQKTSEYEGWKTFTWTSEGVSFKHPGDWVTNETASMGRVYVKNSTVDLTKEETPADFQQVWLSVDTDESAKAREDAIKAGSSDYRVVSGEVKAATIKSGDLTINTYEYTTVGGTTLEAYWTGKDGKRYFATNSTEVGEQNQADMVATLKKVLATVAFTD
jgi:hypothetical protein